MCAQAEEEQRQVAAAAALAAEEAAAGEVAEAYEASLPDDVKTKVADALEREVVSGGEIASDRRRRRQHGCPSAVSLP